MTFVELHQSGHFIIPNAWDVGSARILEAMGFQAIATTSSGHAAALGRSDQQVTLDELVDHVRALSDAVEIPVSVDAEFGFSGDLAGLGEVVDRIAEAGAAGMSIEDYIPERGILQIGDAVDRVGHVVQEAKGSGLVITARAENNLYRGDDFEDILARLAAFEEVGADVVYAPFVKSIEQFAAMTEGLDRPLNALLLNDGPSVDELAAVGVRRMSTGGALALTAYGSLERAAQELIKSGTSTYSAGFLSSQLRLAAFG